VPLAGTAPRSAPDLVGWSTETRNRSPAAAAAEVADILRRQRARGRRLLFKKIDSTLRGPVAAELAALLSVLAPPLVVVCPAHPAAGRTVQGGILRVHGVPVAETEFARDPGAPVGVSGVTALLQAGGVAVTACVGSGQLAPSARGVVVADASTPDDLRQLVAATRALTPAAVLVGSGALAAALAEALPPPEGAGAAGTKADPALPRPTLIVCGSQHPASRRQMARLAAVGVPVIEVGEAEVAARAATALRERGVAALALPDGAEAAGSDRLEALGAAVRAVGRQTAPRSRAATGGETARAVATALGVSALAIDAELAPGLVRSRPEAGPPGLQWIVTKPGGFGGDDVWVRLLG
jgi:uncharacterized protein YgbK (DUF1537 family)